MLRACFRAKQIEKQFIFYLKAKQKYEKNLSSPTDLEVLSPFLQV